MEYLQKLFANRTGESSFGRQTEPYRFEKVKKTRCRTERERPEIPVIDLGVSEPSTMADAGVIDILYKQAKEWGNQGYADNGILLSRQAATAYMGNMSDTSGLCLEARILHSMGSKSAPAVIPQAFVNPGDIALMIMPGYPILGTKTEWLSGGVYPLPLLQENHFLLNLDTIPQAVLQKAELPYLNYSSDLTGAAAAEELYKAVIEFAKKNEIIMIQDTVHDTLTFGERPLSLLSMEGAMGVGIEVHPLSKSYNMAGWRLGLIVGNEKVVKTVTAVKSNNDSGQFIAIQHTRAYALSYPETAGVTYEKYHRRHELLPAALRRIGFLATPPKAPFYEYMMIPEETRDDQIFHTVDEFSDCLLWDALISTASWSDMGHYIRVSVMFIADGEQEEARIVEEVERRLTRCELVS